MFHLSIIIPALAETSALEDTLVSVLSNRPVDCEVIVPHTANYSDPYGLGDEIRLLELKSKSTPSELVAHAIEKATGEFVHLLMPGCEVVEGWCDEAVQAFSQRDVASVSPALLPRFDSTTAVLGVAQGLGGRRLEKSGEFQTPGGHPSRSAVNGPTSTAAFYRRAALVDIGGWPGHISLSLADLDVALSLTEAGYASAFSNSSKVACQRRAVHAISALALARDQERVFQRHRRGAMASWLRPIMSTLQCVAAGNPWRIAMAAVGKTMACFDGAQSRSHRQLLEEAAQHLLQRNAEAVLSSQNVYQRAA